MRMMRVVLRAREREKRGRTCELVRLLFGRVTKNGSRDNIDTSMSADLAFPNDATGHIFCSLRMPLRFGIIPDIMSAPVNIQCENGELQINNFVWPTLYHSIQVSTKTGPGGTERKKRVEKIYTPTASEVKGEDWWMT